MQYIEAIERLIGLLNPGGFFLMLIAESVTFYTVGDKKWSCPNVTFEEVKEALAKAGWYSG